MATLRPIALVTGASGGLGEAFAHELARRGYDLVLTARRRDKLQAVADAVTSAHGVLVTPILADLTLAEAADELWERTEGNGLRIEVLVNNAGLAHFGGFLETEWEKHAAEIGVDVVALSRLVHRFGAAMAKNGHGYILNVSSLVGHLPLPRYATYAASKAYVLSLSQALRSELAPRGVLVMALCPGAIRTDFFEAAGHSDLSFAVRNAMMTPERVAQKGLRALFAGRRVCVPGALNKLALLWLRLIPARFAVWLANRFFV